MVDLDTLRELYAWMRQEKVLYARMGELELRLEPQLPAPSLIRDEQPVPDDEERTLDELLYSSGLDPDALRAMIAKGRS